MIALITALGLWRLSAGPVSLAVLMPYIEDALSRNESNFHLFFDDLILTWAGWERSFDIRAIDVRVFRADGQASAAIPEMAVEFSLQALAKGLIAPTRIDIFGPNVQVTRHADGRIEFGGGPSGAPGNAIGRQFLAQLLDRPTTDHPMGYLREVRVFGAHFVLDDQALQAVWRAPHTNIAVVRRDVGIRLDLDGVFDIDPDGVVIHVSSFYDRDTGVVDLTADFTEIAPAALADISPTLEPLAAVQLPIGGRIRLYGPLTGQATTVSFDVYGGPGIVNLPELGTIGTERSISHLQARGRYESADRGLHIDSLFVDFDGPQLEIAGRFAGQLESPDTVAEIIASNIPVADIEKFWPEGTAEGGRSWVLAHVADGLIETLNVRLNLRPDDWPKAVLDNPAVVGRFTVTGARVDYLEGVQPATDIVATGLFDAGNVDVTIDQGWLGTVRIDQATVGLHDLDRPGEIGEVEGAFSGSVRDVLAILSAPRFQFPQAVGLNAADVASGEMQAGVKLQLPLRADVPIEEISVSVDAAMTDLSLDGDFVPALFQRQGGVRGDARITASQSGLTLSGDIELAGVPAQLTWHETFAPTLDSERRRIYFDGRLDEEVRSRLGMTTERVSGPLDLHVEVFGRDGARSDIMVTIDAVDASIALPEVDWYKPVGTPSVATFRLDLADGVVLGAQDVEIVSDGLAARGTVTLATPDADIATLRVDRLQIGDTDVVGIVHLRRAGPHEVQLRGGRADLRALLADDPVAETTGPAMTVSGGLAAARIDDDIVLYDVSGGLHYNGLYVDSAQITGDFGDQKPIALEIVNGNNQRSVQIVSDAAGSVARATGAYDKMTGGRLRLAAVIDDSLPDRPMRGRLLIEDFHVVDAPMLAQALTIGSLTGALEMLDGEGLPFDELIAEFEMIGDQLAIAKSRATGLSIGFTMEGNIDLATEIADLKGTVVPAYAINSALGEIPLIGEFLVGGEGEGVFAATYVMTGDLNNPSISVNPLAALAPGFLRDLFDAFDSEATSQTNDVPVEERTRQR